MNAIVSVTSDWAIGNEGGLIVRNRADMRRFVSLTMGGTVLMGRTTFESFPGGPLKGRRNVVVTRDRQYALRHEGVECAQFGQLTRRVTANYVNPNAGTFRVAAQVAHGRARTFNCHA